MAERLLKVMAGLDDLQRILDHRFNDVDNLNQALRHRSWCTRTGETSNERLEFLGDGVIGCVVAHMLFERLPDAPEGTLAVMRSYLVSAEVLADVAAEIGLGNKLLLDDAETANGGRLKRSVLSDAFEAVIGAVIIDAGLGKASEVVERLLDARVSRVVEEGPESVIDPKSRLQDISQRLTKAVPEYTFQQDGPDHDPTFTAKVRVADNIIGSGVGASKKAAGAAAAREAILVLVENLDKSAD